MKTIRITPRGYCHGVVNAINTITNLDTLSTKKPIYILGMVIHNKKVVDSLSQMDLISLHDESKTRLELLDEIDSGTVIFTAHGVSPQVYNKAMEKGLSIIDTTCDDVIKSQDTITEYASKGYEVIFIGNNAHPESEAAIGISDKVHVIEKIDDLFSLTIDSNKVALTNQTTMSIFDVFSISEEAKKRYPNIVIIDEICNATRIRQEAVEIQEKNVDHCFVVGDKLSNNSRKLSEVSQKIAHINSTLIESVEDIDINKLREYTSVSVTSGASTPTKITKEVISFLEQFDKDNPSTHINKSSLTKHNLLSKKPLPN